MTDKEITDWTIILLGTAVSVLISLWFYWRSEFAIQENRMRSLWKAYLVRSRWSKFWASSWALPSAQEYRRLAEQEEKEIADAIEYYEAYRKCE